MSLNESVVEDAAFECFEELGYVLGHGPEIALGEPAAGHRGVRERAAAGLDRAEERSG